MKVIVDTCVWSLALRRKANMQHPHVREFRQLILEGRVQLLGAIRQEILSGVVSQFGPLRDQLRSFPDLALESSEYELAAEFFNVCRSAGIQGSHVDFLLCAAAVAHQMPLLTTDDDFPGYARHIPVRLLTPRAGN